MDSANAYIYGQRQRARRTGQPVHRHHHYLVTDLLGSVRGTVSSTGTLTATTSYDAWGNPADSRRPHHHHPFGYAGGYTDPTGLIYLINRYYDPGHRPVHLRRPTAARDPFAIRVRGRRPSRHADPTGLYWVWVYSHYGSTGWSSWAPAGWIWRWLWNTVGLGFVDGAVWFQVCCGQADVTWHITAFRWYSNSTSRPTSEYLTYSSWFVQQKVHWAIGAFWFTIKSGWHNWHYWLSGHRITYRAPWTGEITPNPQP